MKKIALIHDGLITKGGAERVFLYFCQAFPQADVFSAVYYPNKTFPEFKSMKIRTTWYNLVAKNEFSYRNMFFPLGVMAAKSLDLSDYDIVIQSTTTGAKYAKVSSHARVISYIHQPFRLLWSPNSYSVVREARGLKRLAFNWVIRYLRAIDYDSVRRPDVIIANSQNTACRIKEVYDREANFVLKPPINCDDFYVSEEIEDYFLVVSRLEPYKKVDLAIRAFNALGLPLKVVGDGTQRKHLESLAGKNVEFYHNVDQDELSLLYSRAQALVFPQEEDYGITPLESIASGRPVIGFNKGGLLETMIPYCGDASKCTALFFDEQNEESLIKAVKNFKELEFDSNFIKSYSNSFDVSSFIESICRICFDLE